MYFVIKQCCFISTHIGQPISISTSITAWAMLKYNSPEQQENTNKGNKYHDAFDVDRFLKIYNRHYIQSVLKEKLTGS